MNRRVVPADAEAAAAVGRPMALTAAMVTASYAPDLERCRLLCETMDARVTGLAHHYILVEPRDVAQFRQLESSRRTVVDERDLLPSWLHVVDDPLSRFRRRIWLSLRTMPMRGWHVQQLRRIGIAAHVDADMLIYCDSDVAFLKPFDTVAFRRGGKLRLYRQDNGLPATGGHPVWSRNAAVALGIQPSKASAHDYVSTLVAWDRRTVTAMCERIEAVNGRHWVAVLGSRRRFSECIVYGRYVDDVTGGAGHFHSSEAFCRIHWTGTALSDDEFRAFVAGMAPQQVAVGMQSFIGTDLGRIRRLVQTV